MNDETDDDNETTCFFCRKPGEIVCNSPECQKHDRDLKEDYEIQQRKMRADAFRAALSDRCKSDRNFGLNRFWRWFYTAKLVVCIWFDWRGSSGFCSDNVCVASFNHQKLYAGWSEEYAFVGHGVFTNWFWEYLEDGDWNM